MKNHSEQIKKRFKTNVICKLEEFANNLNISIRTVQRKFKSLELIKSYDHNSSYFALQETAQFNNYGIWKYTNVHFSKFGNLRSTFIAIIQQSESGLKFSEIGEILGIDPRQTSKPISRHTR